MEYGTIGAGTIAQAVARHLVAAGHRVVLSNSRGPSSLNEVVSNLGPLASAGTVTQGHVPWSGVRALACPRVAL
ncbi:NAD(P)-binding domain-containing protein, partial [Mycobacterium avium]